MTSAYFPLAVTARSVVILGPYAYCYPQCRWNAPGFLSFLPSGKSSLILSRREVDATFFRNMHTTVEELLF